MGCSSVPIPPDSYALNTRTLDNKQVQALIEHLKALSADQMAGRQFASFGNTQAKNYITASLIASNVQAFQQKYHHIFNHNTFLSDRLGTNIIGLVRGTEQPESYIVLSAHYDHLGIRGNKVFNGADDNASGTSALLVFGEAISKKPLKHSVILLFTDGEEVNLLGAKAFIKQHKKILPNIKININIDMIAGNKNTRILHYIDKGLETILPENKQLTFKILSNKAPVLVKRHFKRDLQRINSRTRWNNASDHAVFTHLNIPFIYYGVGEHKNYHTIDDEFENVNLHFFKQASQSIFQYLIFLDQHIK